MQTRVSKSQAATHADSENTQLNPRSFSQPAHSSSPAPTIDPASGQVPTVFGAKISSAQPAVVPQLQAQVERARQFGFDPMQVSLFAGGNPPIQPQLGSELPAGKAAEPTKSAFTRQLESRDGHSPERISDSLVQQRCQGITQRQQASATQAADMTSTFEEAEGGAAGQSEQPSLSEQFPEGISITLALQPERSEIAAHSV